MLLHKDQWREFSTYLYFDRKLSRSKGSLHSDRSRFNILVEYFGTRPFNRLSFTIFIAGLKEKGYKNTYINNFIKLSKHLDKFLGHNYISDYTYFRENISPKEVLTPEEIRNLCNIKVPYRKPAQRQFLQKKWDLLLTLISVTGCRVGEAVALKKENVYSDYVIFINTKSGKDRIVPIPAELANNIRTLPHTESVFNIRDTSSVGEEMKRRGKLLGITKPLYPHILRHSFITTMLQYADSLLIARLVGHEDPSTTQRYNHANLEQLRAIQMYHPLLRENLSLQKISEGVVKTIEKLVDPARYNFSMENGRKRIVFTIFEEM